MAFLSSLFPPDPETVSHVTGSAGGYYSSVVNRFVMSRSTVFCSFLLVLIVLLLTVPIAAGRGGGGE
jgi:hypothetical protein